MKLKIILSALIMTLLLVSCSGSKAAKNEKPDREKTYIERFEDGQASFEKKQYYNSLEDFKFVVFNAPGSDIADNAQFYLAESQFELNEFLLAINEFTQLLSRWPQSELHEKTRYRIAECYYQLTPHYTRDQSYAVKAISSYQSFIDEYPLSKYRDEAEQRISELRLGLAKKIYDSAKVYMVLREWKAATITLQEIVDTYYDTAILQKTYLAMADSYCNLEDYESMVSTLDKIKENKLSPQEQVQYNNLTKRLEENLK